MKTLFQRLVVAIIFLFGCAGAALAGDVGTADEAVALVKKAIVYYKKHGRDKIVEEINRRQGVFVFKDLYISVATLDGVVLAHGIAHRMVGKDLSALKDVEGHPITLNLIKLAK